MSVFGVRHALAVGMAATTMFGVARAESLVEALTSAYLNNPAIASALYGVKIAAENIAGQRAGRRPNISASASATFSDTLAGGTSTTTGGASAGLSFSQNLFNNLRTSAAIDQARALADAAAEGLRSAEQGVLLSAATAYIDVVRDTELASLRSENVSFLKAQVESAQDRLSIGEGTRIDVSQAESRLAQAVAAYRSAVNSLQTSRASYARWIGHPPNSPSASYDFDGMLPASLDEALVAADTRHPANLSARAQVEAARYATDAALRAFGPTLDLVGGITSSVSTTGTSPSTTGSISLKLAIPIYSGGALGSGARAASLRQTQAELDAQETYDSVRESAIAAWSGMQTAIAQIDSANSAVSASQLALDGVIEERRVGQRTTLDVLNARAELIGAREALIGAKYGRFVSYFSMLAAVGRLNAVDLGLPVSVRNADGYRESVEDIWKELRDVDRVEGN